MKTKPESLFLLLLVLVVFIWSAISPHDYFTWMLEVFPAVIGAIVLGVTYRKFRLTPLVYTLIALHMIVFVISVCLAFSALYELFEWIVSMLTGSAGDAFLGTQGDVFDTQKDMAMALTGAVTALVTLSKVHDEQLASIERSLSRDTL